MGWEGGDIFFIIYISSFKLLIEVRLDLPKSLCATQLPSPPTRTPLGQLCSLLGKLRSSASSRPAEPPTFLTRLTSPIPDTRMRFKNKNPTDTERLDCICPSSRQLHFPGWVLPPPNQPFHHGQLEVNQRTLTRHRNGLIQPFCATTGSAGSCRNADCTRSRSFLFLPL